MRTTVEENAELGRRLAVKLNNSHTPTVVVFPQGGVSLLDAPGQAFEGVREREALYNGIVGSLNSTVPLVTTPKELNDPEVAQLIAEKFLQLYDSLNQK
jgi:uncharacterized protein (UPF0261 family)